MFNLLVQQPNNDLRVTKHDLVLATGTFRPTPSGVLARLNPPLARLSSHCEWPSFSKSLAVLKLLVVGEDEVIPVINALGFASHELDALDKQIGRINWHLGGNHLVLEHESDLCDDLLKLLRWSADACPYRSVTRDLVRLQTMTDRELVRYVGNLDTIGFGDAGRRRQARGDASSSH